MKLKWFNLNGAAVIFHECLRHQSPRCAQHRSGPRFSQPSAAGVSPRSAGLLQRPPLTRLFLSLSVSFRNHSPLMSFGASFVSFLVSLGGRNEGFCMISALCLLLRVEVWPEYFPFLNRDQQ